MRNPLNKRLPRELKHDFGKYLVIFLFMVMMISLVSWEFEHRDLLCDTRRVVTIVIHLYGKPASEKLDADTLKTGSSE